MSTSTTQNTSPNSIAPLNTLSAAVLTRRSRPIIYVDTDTTLDHTLSTLKRHNILSVPVYNRKEGQIVGIVHMEDILMYMMAANFKKEEYISLSLDNEHKPIGVLIGVSSEGKITWTASVTDTVVDVMEAMSKGVHRMLIYKPIEEEEEGLCIPFKFPHLFMDKKEEDTFENLRLVTQMDLVRFISEHLENNTLEGVHFSVDRPIREIKHNWNHLETMKSSEPALKGFSQMASKEVSALAIVADDGQLVANLSGSDLRGMSTKALHRVLLPVLEFLKKTHDGRIPPAVQVTDRYTVREIINKMLALHIHRVWVVDGFNNKPIGVITLTDLISLFYNNERVPVPIH